MLSIYKLMAHPRFYLWVQRALGADRLRKLCLDRFVQAQPRERILDLGCGPGYVLDYLPQADYVGFDTEPKYIDYARGRYAGRGRFYCENFCERHVDTLGPFDVILMFGLLHHLDDANASALLGLASRCLTAGGRVVTLDPCFTPDQSAMARRVALSDRGKFVRTAERYDALARSHFPGLAALVVHNVCRIPSTERIMRLSRLVHAGERIGEQGDCSA